MTTEINHNPIDPKVVRKQYQRGMSLPELCRLYDTVETMIRPLIEGVEQESRDAVSLEDNTETELLEQVKELIEVEKMSVLATSEVLGIPTSRVKKVMKKNGIQADEKYRVNKQGENRDDEAFGKRMVEMFNEGMAIKAICNELGISHPTYYAIRKKLGLNLVRGKGRRKGTTRESLYQEKYAKEKPKRPNLIHRLDQKEEPPVKETTTANLESAVTAFKPEEVSEVIGAVQKHIEHKKPSTRIINRDKDVWAEYLTARSEEIHDVAHTVDVVLEDGKLIERTVLSYTLEREVTR